MDNSGQRSVSKVVDARLISQNHSSEERVDIVLAGSNIEAIVKHNDSEEPLDSRDVIDAKGCLIGPSLCHSHVHLDKCFIFNDPKYSDLEVVEGDFKEALELTSKAKARFEEDDILRRGRWLIDESVAYGVTCMRAFVEVDHMVEFKSLKAALQLKSQYKDACHIQICVFAQEPIFSGKHAQVNRDLITTAIQENPEVDVLGTTPYVEDSQDTARENIEWAFETALQNDKHLDFHLDYNLDPSKPPQIDIVINTAIEKAWTSRTKTRDKNTPDKCITLGHCTRLTLYTLTEWQSLSQKITTANLPIHFIGLPTSDLFIMGKPPATTTTTQDRPRGTLQIPHLIKHHNLSAAISINNVGNAFTPYGNVDPLSIACLGVGIYQAGTKSDAALLYDCVSGRAKRGIGLGGLKDDGHGGPFGKGAEADFVLYSDSSSLRQESESGSGLGLKRPVRIRRNVQQLVYDPPPLTPVSGAGQGQGQGRRVIYKGRLISP